VIILDDSLGILTNPLIISGMDRPDICHDEEEEEREEEE
jgi:hypothetical protein